MFRPVYDSVIARLYPRLGARNIDLRRTEPIVTFTFDDFPASALEVGGSLLEGFGWRGTFYMSMGLSGSGQSVGKIAGLDDVSRALEAGHEVCNHSFGHIDYSAASRRGIQQDFNQNQAALGEGATTNFAYPKGQVSPEAKWTVGRMAGCARGVSRGINQAGTDLNWLQANPIYSSESMEGPLEAVRQVAADGGWLIFYTHDISDTPSKFGCVQQDFETVLKAVERSGISVLRVQDALRGIGV